MNRDERRRLKRVIQDYDRRLRTAYFEFESEVSAMKDNELEKLDSLPPSFVSSPVAEMLTETVDMINNILEKGEEIIDVLDEILSFVEVTSAYTPAPQKTKIIPEKKNVSFHALLPLSLLKRLKEESLCTGVSMNEIICRALSNEMEN